MPVAAGAARHMVVEMTDVFREVVGGRNGPGGRVVGASVVAVAAERGPNEGEFDAESVAISFYPAGVPAISLGTHGGRRGARPVGAPRLTYGRSMAKAMDVFNLDHALAGARG